MPKLSQKDISFIEKYIENAEQLLKTTNVKDILHAIDKFICINGFDDEYNLTDIGEMAQKTYDNIYFNN